jgi:peptidoglycan hydrolase CwlO-like protein
MTDHIKNEINDIKKDLHILNDKLDIIMGKLDNLNDKINLSYSMLETITESSKNMDQHISFIENVYTVLKYPFSKILFWYDKSTNINQLPTINKKIEN